MTLGLSTAARNAMLDAIATAAGSGAKIRFYTGTQPATGAAITSQTQLAELTVAGTFGTSSGGVLTVGTVTGDSSADNTGTADWFRIVKSDGTTHVMDGTLRTSGGDINLNTLSIVAGATVNITSLTITAGNT